MFIPRISILCLILQGRAHTWGLVAEMGNVYFTHLTDFKWVLMGNLLGKLTKMVKQTFKGRVVKMIDNNSISYPPQKKKSLKRRIFFLYFCPLSQTNVHALVIVQLNINVKNKI